ncbi:uncharacterized protein BHQ10_006127 [Talaromyces amestolkiae]|uniref:Uncharacterized protein n=1 Tax=Talaromyces amestolkiae TaxID=1196081 RepID=A0A364L2U1_TALAM|nr:uncharacterized protein BHQ10_006127 [Talaromyces amestolkiae]RAO70115.1 hypothetical protein BHQ10_006127 [Talaromyces amestolkiae]
MTQSSDAASGMYTQDRPPPLMRVTRSSSPVLIFLLDSCPGTESSLDMLLEKALEKVVNNAIDQINEATTKAIDKAIKNSVETALTNCVGNAIENAVQNAVEYAVESAVESAVDNTIEDAVEKAVEKSMAKYLDPPRKLVPSHPTEQQDASQNESQIDMVSEIPETQRGPMEVNSVAENITGNHQARC